MLVLKVTVIGPRMTWFRLLSPPGTALPATHQTRLVLGDQVALLGYDIEPVVVRQGEEVHLRLYWQALKPIGVSYASFVHLRAGADAVATSDASNPGDIPTSLWHTTLYTVDDHWLAIPASAPAVAVRPLVGLYDGKTGDRLGQVELPQYVHVVPRRSVSASDAQTKKLSQNT
jgi:hypothetical protein